MNACINQCSNLCAQPHTLTVSLAESLLYPDANKIRHIGELIHAVLVSVIGRFLFRQILAFLPGVCVGGGGGVGATV